MEHYIYNYILSFNVQKDVNVPAIKESSYTLFYLFPYYPLSETNRISFHFVFMRNVSASGKREEE